MTKSWYTASGAMSMCLNSGISYSEYLEKAGTSLEHSDACQIDLDIPRTVVSLYRYVLQKNVSEDTTDLDHSPIASYMKCSKNILQAYCVRNPRVGYVQGHGDVISFLLGALGSEEENVFWIYCVLLERILPGDYYSKNPKLQGFHVDMEMFSKLFATRFTLTLDTIQKDEAVSLASLLAFKWFLSVFVKELPFDQCCVIWDAILTSKQGVVIPMRAALEVYAQVEQQVLKYARENDAEASMMYKQVLILSQNVLLTKDILLQDRFGISEISIEKMREDIRAVPAFSQEEINALHGITHFDREQLEQLQREFRILKENARNQGGAALRGIDKTTLRQVLTRVIPEWPLVSYNQLFEALDMDTRGFIEFQNLMLTLSVLCKGTLDEKLKLCFELYDNGKKGFLDVEDMILLAGALSRIYQFKLNQHNSETIVASPDISIMDDISSSSPTKTTRSNSISSIAALGVSPTKDTWLKNRAKNDTYLSIPFISTILSMDNDGKRKITFEEWCMGARSNQNVVQCFLIQVQQESTLSPPIQQRSHSSELWVNRNRVQSIQNQSVIDMSTGNTTQIPSSMGSTKRRISLLPPNMSQMDDTNTDSPHRTNNIVSSHDPLQPRAKCQGCCIA